MLLSLLIKLHQCYNHFTVGGKTTAHTISHPALGKYCNSNKRNEEREQIAVSCIHVQAQLKTHIIVQSLKDLVQTLLTSQHWQRSLPWSASQMDTHHYRGSHFPPNWVQKKNRMCIYQKKSEKSAKITECTNSVGGRLKTHWMLSTNGETMPMLLPSLLCLASFSLP